MEAILIALIVSLLLFISFLLLKAYKPSWFEGFAVSNKGEAPAAAPPQMKAVPAPARVVAPAGPAAPAQQAPVAPRELPAEKPVDPYDNVQGAIPLEDNLRHPENSFAPGIKNTGSALSEASGVASQAASGPNTFTPELIQNSGEFMTGVVANTPDFDAFAPI